MRYGDVMAVLKRALKARGWTYARLGEAIGMSESGIKKVLSGEDGGFNRVLQICEVLELELDDVLALVEVSPEPWRLSEVQEALFEADPACWWFLQALARSQWSVEAVQRRHTLSGNQVQLWLTRLELAGVIRRNAKGDVMPDDAAGRPWQAGPRHGEAVIKPLQDALLAHVRARIVHKADHPMPEVTECGFGWFDLSPSSAREFKQALREVVSKFAAQGRRDKVAHGEDALVPVGVLTAMAPFRLPVPSAE